MEIIYEDKKVDSWPLRTHLSIEGNCHNYHAPLILLERPKATAKPQLSLSSWCRCCLAAFIMFYKPSQTVQCDWGICQNQTIDLLESNAGLCQHQPVHFELDLESDAELRQLQTVQVHFAELVSVCFTAMLCVRLGAIFNIKIGTSILHETICSGMVYVYFTNSMKKIQIGFIFFYNIDFSWLFIIPDNQGCRRICWLL